MMGLFSKKTKTTAGTPAAGMDMTPMVRMLAAASEEQRTQMLTDRMAVFAAQPEEERVAGMGAMVRAGLSLADEEYERVASSRLAVLMGLPPEERMPLMQGHTAAVKGLEEGDRRKELRTMKSVISRLPDEQQAMVSGMMQQLGLDL